MSNKILQETINDVVKSEASKAGQTPTEYINSMKERINSGDPSGAVDLESLNNQIIITYQDNVILHADDMKLVRMSLRKPDKSMLGNGYREVLHYIQSGEDFNKNRALFPTTLKNPVITKYEIKLYNDDGSLAAGASQKVFTAVFRKASLITKFIENQLSEFWEKEIIGQVNQPAEIQLVRTAWEAISKATGGKQITSTATNAFDAFCELTTHAQKMRTNTATYNYDQSIKMGNWLTKEDLVAIMSPNVYAKLKSSIKSRLYNVSQFDLESFVGEVLISNTIWKEITDSNGNNIIVPDDDNYYIPDNKVIIMERSLFNIIKMFKFTGTQDYPNAAAEGHFYHLWLASGFKTWGKLLVFNSNNLLTDPEDGAQVRLVDKLSEGE